MDDPHPGLASILSKSIEKLHEFSPVAWTDVDLSNVTHYEQEGLLFLINRELAIAEVTGFATFKDGGRIRFWGTLRGNCAKHFGVVWATLSDELEEYNRRGLPVLSFSWAWRFRLTSEAQLCLDGLLEGDAGPMTDWVARMQPPRDVEDFGFELAAPVNLTDQASTKPEPAASGGPKQKPASAANWQHDLLAKLGDEPQQEVDGITFLRLTLYMASHPEPPAATTVSGPTTLPAGLFSQALQWRRLKECYELNRQLRYGRTADRGYVADLAVIEKLLSVRDQMHATDDPRELIALGKEMLILSEATRPNQGTETNQGTEIEALIREVKGLLSRIGQGPAAAGKGESTDQGAPKQKPASAAKTKTPRGGGDDKIINALIHHHRFDSGVCEHTEAISVAALAPLAGVSKPTVSRFLKKQFPQSKLGGYIGYCNLCRSQNALAALLKALDGDCSTAWHSSLNGTEQAR
jgi:hypothetical protein